LTTYVVQPKDSDLDAIAALVTTSFGRALLAAVDLPALQAILGSGTPSSSTYLRGDGTWSTPPTGVGGGAVDSVNGQTGDITLTASDVGAQPVDSDLTAIAALTTTGFGRSVLAASDAAALRVLAGAVIGTDVQAADSDLTAIAALTTTSFGRGLLTEASAASARTTLGLVIGTDVQAQSAELSTLGALTSTALGRAILESSNAAQVRTLTNAQALDTDLTAIAALVSTADKLPYATGAGTWALADFGSFARSINALTTASAWRTGLGLVIGTDVQAADADLTAIAALTTTTYGRSVLTVADATALRVLAGLVIGTNVQAWDADLDAVAALTTTSYGRNFLTLSNLAAVQALLGTGTPSSSTYLRGDGTWASPTAGPAGVIATDTLWDAAGDLAVGTGADTAARLALGAASTFLRVNSGGTALEYAALLDADIPAAIARDAEVAAGYQPLDSDLTAIAALTTTTYGRSLLAAADSASLRALAGLVIGADVQAYDADLANIAALATTSYGRSILTVADAAALRAYSSSVIGVNVQAFNSKLESLANLTGVTDTVPYFTSSTTLGTTSLTSYARTLIDDTTASAARTTLGLGTSATVNTGSASGDIALLGTGGRFDIARLASGTPTGLKFVRDDGTLAVPAGGVGSTPEGLVTGVINGTDATYGMVADGKRITDAALGAGASPVLTSASSPFVSGDVGKVVQLYRDVYIQDAAITSGSAVLTSASNSIPAWIQPGMVVHVGGAGNTGQAGGPDTLVTTVLTNDGVGQLTLATTAHATVAGTVAAPKPTLIYGLFKSTVAAYTNAGSVTLSGTSPYSFTAAAAAWGTDNRVAFTAAAAAAVAANKKLVLPAGGYLILLTQSTPNAIGLLTEGILNLSGAGRTLTDFMVVTDGVQTVETNLIQRGTNLDLELSDFKISYFGPQLTALSSTHFYAIHTTGRIGDTRERWIRAYRVDFDPTYRPIEGISQGAGSGFANTTMILEDCRLYGVSSGAMSCFANGIRTVTNGVTNSTPTVTSATFNLTVNDLGKRITGTGIPTNSFIGVINSTTSLELSSAPTTHIPVLATTNTTGVTLDIEGAQGRVYANRCRFDTSQQLLTRVGDTEMNAHAVYAHPFIAASIHNCTFSIKTRTTGAYHWHGNGGANGYPKFYNFSGCSFEGNGRGFLFSGGAGIQQVTITNCQWSGSSSIGTFPYSTTLLDCSASGLVTNGATFTGGTGTVSRVIGGTISSTKSNFVPFTLQAGSAGAKLVVKDINVTMGTNWAAIVGLSGSNQQDLVFENCTLVGPASGVSFFVFPQNASSVVFRNNICSGSLINAPVYAASGTWTGRAVLDGNDFSAMTVAAAAQDNQTTGTNSNIEILPTNKFGSNKSYLSAGRSGARFTARQATNTTAITTTTTTLLLPDSDANSYVLNPGSTYTLNNVCRHTQASRVPTDETIWLTNSSANTITLGTGTGHGALTTVGADTAFAAGDLLMLRGNGASGWHARIVS
jgi:hypothetical protein